MKPSCSIHKRTDLFRKEKRFEAFRPRLRTTVLKHLATAREDDDPKLGIAKHGELMGLLQEPSPALREGDLPVGGVLNPLDLDLASSHD